MRNSASCCSIQNHLLYRNTWIRFRVCISTWKKTKRSLMLLLLTAAIRMHRRSRYDWGLSSRGFSLHGSTACLFLITIIWNHCNKPEAGRRRRAKDGGAAVEGFWLLFGEPFECQLLFHMENSRGPLCSSVISHNSSKKEDPLCNSSRYLLGMFDLTWPGNTLPLIPERNQPPTSEQLECRLHYAAVKGVET